MSVGLAAVTHQGFWASGLATALVIVACALVVGVTVAALLRRRARPASVRERVAGFVSGKGPTESDSADQLLRGMLARSERTLERKRWWDELETKLEVARIDRPAIEVVYLTIACALGAALLLSLLAATPLAGVVGLIVVPLLARTLIEKRAAHDRVLFGEQLPAHLQELASAMRAGHSMVSGIGLLADGASQPSQGEFRRVVADEQLGMPLEDALRLVGARMHAQDMGQVSLVAELHRQTGGNMAEVLDRVAESVRARAELNRELRTLTAQARGSRWVVSLIPPFLLVIIYALNPVYLEPLFSTGTGLVLLALSFCMILAGSWVMSRIVRIEV